MSIMDKVTNRFKVKVYKRREDARKGLCGEFFIRPTQKEHDGDPKGEYCIIPAHQADFINKTYRHYDISEPFIPGIDDAKGLAVQPKETPETLGYSVKSQGFGRYEVVSPKGESVKSALTKEDATAEATRLNQG